VLRLTGWKSDANESDGKKKILEQMERELPQFLKKTFADGEVTVSPATGLPPREPSLKDAG
jgi:hypothetical protein